MQRMIRRQIVALLLLALSLVSIGCVGEDLVGTSKLTLTLSGGEALRTGFPHKEGSTTHEFVDGWTAKFTKYVVVVGNIRLTDPETKAVVGSWDKSVVADLMATGSDQSIGTKDLTTLSDLPARRLDFGFDVTKATSSTENRSAKAEDLKMMIDKGWSHYAEGEATKNEETIQFKLGVGLNIRYEECSNGVDNSRGIALENQKTTLAQLNSHVVHLFWDSFATGDEDLRFAPFAAVAGDDKIVTSDELKQQDLTQLKGTDGKPLQDNGKSVFYNDAGLLPPDSLTLFDFYKYGVQISFHFNGLGLCRPKPIN
ncbi:MAG: hypothetical protein EP343_27040 [Deltaproteobacteria bacterium]|nr:MAG: hypothetical protein EP343_27040 [Deltaproteobacteria bacterium]